MKNLLEIANAIRCQNRDSQTMHSLVDLFNECDRKNIFFGKNKYHFKTNKATRIDELSYDEHYINNVYYDLHHGSIDYVVRYDGKTDKALLYFTENCAVIAYTMYLFYNNLLKISDDLSIAFDLHNKYYKDLSHYEMRLINFRRISYKEFLAYNITQEEFEYLFKILNIC